MHIYIYVGKTESRYLYCTCTEQVLDALISTVRIRHMVCVGGDYYCIHYKCMEQVDYSVFSIVYIDRQKKRNLRIVRHQEILILL